MSINPIHKYHPLCPVQIIHCQYVSKRFNSCNMNYSILFTLIATINFYQISFSFQTPIEDFGHIAKTCNARLPTGRYGTAAAYDGSDSIYIFDGYSGILPPSPGVILRYSIHSDSIQVVARFPNMSQSHFGSVISNTDKGNYYYFGGLKHGKETKDILKFTPGPNATMELINATLPNYLVNGNAFKSYPSSNLVYIFDSVFSNQVVQFDMETETIEVVGHLPFQQQFYTTVSNDNGTAYMIGNKRRFGNPPPVPFYSVDLNSFQVSEGTANIPVMKELKPASVFDGDRYIYILGGFNLLDFNNGGILKIDTFTNHLQFLRVEGFPGSGISTFSSTSAVYVPKLDRIYMFGGRTHQISPPQRYLNSIWYIDLNPAATYSPEPVITTPCPPFLLSCANKPDGLYPHPNNCSMYIECEQETNSEFSCPRYEKFHPTILVCTRHTSPCNIKCEF